MTEPIKPIRKLIGVDIGDTLRVALIIEHEGEHFHVGHNIGEVQAIYKNRITLSSRGPIPYGLLDDTPLELKKKAERLHRSCWDVHYNNIGGYQKMVPEGV